MQDTNQEAKQDTRPKFVFTCQRCGRCCEQEQGIAVYLSDIERWAKNGTIYQVFPGLSISMDPESISIRLETEEGRCKMYNSESKECSIYEDRPLACRAYPLKHDGSGYLLRDKECPGIGKGEMSKEALLEIRGAAVDEHQDEARTAAVLPALQAILLKEMTKQSEEAYGKLSDEERAKLEEILKKEK